MGSEWIYFKVSEIANVTDYVANGSFATLKENVTYSSVPDYAILIRLVDFNNNWNGDFVYVSELSYHFLKKSCLDIGDIVISNVGANAGTVFLVPDLGKPTTLGPNSIVLKTNGNKALRKFIYYYFFSSIGQEQIHSIITGSAQPKFNKTDFRNLKVRIPKDKNEQQAIAHILGSLDDKIELNRKMNQTLEAIARAIFKSWFIDFDPVIDNALRAGNPIPDSMAKRAEIRRQILDQNQPSSSSPISQREKGRNYQGGFNFSGLGEGLGEVSIDEIYGLFPDSFQDSKLGPIPMGWEVKEIGEAVKCVGGSTPSTKNPTFWNSGKHPFVTPKDMSSLKSPVILDTSRHITDAGVNKISSGILPIGTVILSSRAPIGYLAITEVPVSVNQGIIAMICNKDLPNYFVLYWTELNIEIIKSNAGGTTFAEISKQNFRPILVVVPSKLVLNAFVQQLEPLHKQIILNLQESTSLSSLRDTFLPKLISGELRIQDAEKLLKEAGV
jgi:type I restriction enzyme S subunit